MIRSFLSRKINHHCVHQFVHSVISSSRSRGLVTSISLKKHTYQCERNEPMIQSKVICRLAFKCTRTAQSRLMEERIPTKYTQKDKRRQAHVQSGVLSYFSPCFTLARTHGRESSIFLLRANRSSWYRPRSVQPDRVSHSRFIYLFPTLNVQIFVSFSLEPMK